MNARNAKLRKLFPTSVRGTNKYTTQVQARTIIKEMKIALHYGRDRVPFEL